MDINLNDVIVHDNITASRYEARVDGHIAVITYERAPGQITFIHTVTPPALAGHSIADKMARTVLEEARAAGLAVIPRCPFIAAYIRRHPEYLDLVPPDEQARYLGE
jgi:predicted GNAT family acetyltransferase